LWKKKKEKIKHPGVEASFSKQYMQVNVNVALVELYSVVKI